MSPYELYETKYESCFVTSMTHSLLWRDIYTHAIWTVNCDMPPSFRDVIHTHTHSEPLFVTRLPYSVKWLLICFFICLIHYVTWYIRTHNLSRCLSHASFILWHDLFTKWNDWFILWHDLFIMWHASFIISSDIFFLLGLRHPRQKERKKDIHTHNLRRHLWYDSCIMWHDVFIIWNDWFIL